VKEISPRLFKIFALSLPKGLDFGSLVPVSSWLSDDKIGCGLILYVETHAFYAFFAMRRREDNVWVVVDEVSNIKTHDDAKTLLERAMASGAPKEPIPEQQRRFKDLTDFEKRNPSDIFLLLARPDHLSAAWVINQLYLSMPNPDKNFVSDFQTDNFHTRLWELYLLACFREQGLEVFQDQKSPDFHIRNNNGEAFVEAVTANPKDNERYNHANTKPTLAPTHPYERQLGSAATRYAKTLRSKIQKNYHDMDHVKGKPLAIAIADFHASSSMVWSREALPCYLYGLTAQVEDKMGNREAVAVPADRLLNDPDIPAGLFNNDENSQLSAVIFSNSCTLGKFNRMGFLAGVQPPGLTMTRRAGMFDPTPGALEWIDIDLDVLSEEYSALWPDGEEWSIELEVFHNPYAEYPLPRELLPFATHWYREGEELICRAHYENLVLSSVTLLDMTEN